MFIYSLATLKEYSFRTIGDSSFPCGLTVLTVMLNSVQSDNTVCVLYKFDRLCGSCVIGSSCVNKNILPALWSLQGIPK